MERLYRSRTTLAMRIIYHPYTRHREQRWSDSAVHSEHIYDYTLFSVVGLVLIKLFIAIDR